ncbi:MAG: N-acetylmuramoyl-L-alanine amidase [Kiritimatiellae bacterium]|nr:N-acetylmuramoyl-L-alanine amidase [Kiritimatiellia bacterium]
MISTLLLAAVPFVSFPSQGAKLPAIEHVYMIGAVQKGDTNVVVNGANVPVYRTGAWATLVDASEGSNEVSVVSQSGEATNVWFNIAKKPVAGPDAKPAPEKKWKKLDYAKDDPKDPPTNKAPNEVTIVVDAGHGGDDTGARSPHGFFEKDANLLVAERLKAALLSRGYNVVMTREADVAIPLYDRPKAAHTNDADAFVSIHHNAPPFDRDPAVRYHAVYSWNPIGEALATAINAKMAAALGDTLKSNGPMHANFAVTRNPEIPSCLVEVDFVTSPSGEESIWDASRRRLVAEAIADGIDEWRKGPMKDR